MDIAGIITATGGAIAVILKVISMQPKKRKAADVTDRLTSLEDRLAAAEDRLLGWAAWAHDARVTSAAAGVRLPRIPARLLGDEEPAVPAPRSSGENTDRTDA